MQSWHSSRSHVDDACHICTLGQALPWDFAGFTFFISFASVSALCVGWAEQHVGFVYVGIETGIAVPSWHATWHEQYVEAWDVPFPCFWHLSPIVCSRSRWGSPATHGPRRRRRGLLPPSRPPPQRKQNLPRTRMLPSPRQSQPTCPGAAPDGHRDARHACPDVFSVAGVLL